MKLIKKYWPFLILVAIEIALFITNYHPGTYLVGWDNLLPEVNLWLNIKRSFWGVWQEYRGLGLFDGMSHVANLIYYLLLVPLVATLPNNVIRYVAVLGTHLAGMIGVFVLAREELFKNRQHKTLGALAAAIFYGLNIGTIQMFYAPYETFTFHFAFLPWLTLYLKRFLDTPSKRLLIIFLILSILATPQAHVPSVWLVYLFSYLTIIGCYLLPKFDKTKLRKALLTIGVVIAANAFWLLPYGLAATNVAPVITDSKINQMSTGEVTMRNDAFGGLVDTLLVKSYMFDFTNRDTSFDPAWFLTAWRDWFSRPDVIFIALIFVVLAGFGVYEASKKTNRRHFAPFLVMFLVMFLLLGTGIPLLGYFSAAARQFIPLFASVFRFTFTKFSTLLVFNYSIFLGLGLLVLIDLQSRHLKKLTPFIFGVLGLVLIFWYAKQAFNDNFLYPNLKNSIPSSYFELWKYLDGQDVNARLVVLPQPNFWGWTDYTWGVRGSGFLWFGMPQSLMDRAFDPWSNYSEQFYWELRQAEITVDSRLLSTVLDKYRVGYLLVDETVHPSTGNVKALVYGDAKNTLVWQKDNLALYQRQNVKNTITSFQNLPIVNSAFNFSERDLAYSSSGDYKDSGQPASIYLFPSLFTNKNQSNLEFTAETSKTSLNIKRTFNLEQAGDYIFDSSSFDDNSLTPVEVWGQSLSNRQLKLVYKSFPPKVSINGQIVSGESLISKEQVVTLDATNDQSVLMLSLNNRDFWEWVPTTSSTKIGESYLSPETSNSLKIFSAKSFISLKPSIKTASESINCGESQPASEVARTVTDNTLTLTAKSASNCTGFALSLPANLLSHSLLVKSVFDYQSKTDELPKYCLSSPTLGHCFNYDALPLGGFSTSAFSKAQGFTEATFYSGLPYSWNLVLDSRAAKKSISIKDLSLEAHPLLADLTLPNIPVNEPKIPVRLLEGENQVAVEVTIKSSSYSFKDPIVNHTYTMSDLECASFPKFAEGRVEQLSSSNGLNLRAKKSLLCQVFTNPTLSVGEGYFLSLVSSSPRGLPLKITARSLDSSLNTLETNAATGQNSFIIPATAKEASGLELGLYVSSVDSQWAETTVSSLVGYPLPYDFLKGLKLTQSPGSVKVSPEVASKFTKVGSVLYITSASQGDLVLWQAFDSHWLGLSFKGLLPHFKVDNWANGWGVPDGVSGPVLLVFWPQLLEQVGFIVLLVFCLFLGLKSVSHRLLDKVIPL